MELFKGPHAVDQLNNQGPLIMGVFIEEIGSEVLLSSYQHQIGLAWVHV